MELIWPTIRFEPRTDGWEARSLLLCYAPLEIILTEQSQQDFISSLSSNYCNSPFNDLKKTGDFHETLEIFWLSCNQQISLRWKVSIYCIMPTCLSDPRSGQYRKQTLPRWHRGFWSSDIQTSNFLISGQAKSKVYRIRLDTPACFSKLEYLLGDHKPSKNVIRHMQCLTSLKKSGGVVMSSRHLRCKPGSFTFSGVLNLIILSLS